MDVNTCTNSTELAKAGMDQLVVDHFGLDVPVADMQEWTNTNCHRKRADQDD